jgi:hypothetical protein
MAGDHEPVIPLVDVVGKGANVTPAQMGGTALKLGIITGFTVITKFATVAQSPAVGVNV